MEPPRRTKLPAGDDFDAKAPRYEVDDGAAAYDFLDDGNEYSDDDLDGVSSLGTGGSIGFLDESGSFVERAARSGRKDDAWLGATDDDPAPVETKRARKALERQEEDERILEGVVGSRAVFHIKKRIAGLLRPGETVPRALRRLKGGAEVEKSRGGGKGVMMMDEAARRAFDELMDASAELVRRGDLDAYTDDREAFERGAWDYEYARRRRLEAAVPEAQRDEEEKADQQTADATRDDDVDMFRDDAVGTGTKTASDSAGEHAIDPDQPAASGAAATEEAGGVAGWGDYVYDPASGYYYSGSTGHYYDAASGCYWSASTGTWFSYHADTDAGQCSGTRSDT